MIRSRKNCIDSTRRVASRRSNTAHHSLSMKQVVLGNAFIVVGKGSEKLKEGLKATEKKFWEIAEEMIAVKKAQKVKATKKKF